MKTYAKYGYNDFYIALGFKSEVIKDFFLNYHVLNSDFSVDLSTGNVTSYQTDKIDWKVTLVNTGDKSMTGGRVKRMKNFIGNETFMLTYGDGVADINIEALLEFHKSHGKMVTISAVHPAARFGEIKVSDNKVTSFKEKPQLLDGWINGGYFVIEPAFFDLIDSDSTLLEQEPLEKVAGMGELMSYCHEGFWQCVDTKRDLELLETLWTSGAPWRN
jgi:glucose-1-phosphate cytidylyltransferase